jgi:GT2 family glycosyltransferase
VVDTVGAFDASMMSGGDREWGQRVARSGYQVVYAPNAVVRHPARRNWSELWAKIKRVGRGIHKLEWEDAPWWPARAEYLGRAVRELLPPVRFLARTATDLQRPPSERAALMGSRMLYLYAAHGVRWRLLLSPSSDSRDRP